MSREWLMIKRYDMDFWQLVDNGKSYRKARRVLKKQYPNVYYDAQKDIWTINGKIYQVEADKSGELKIGGK